MKETTHSPLLLVQNNMGKLNKHTKKNKK